MFDCLTLVGSNTLLAVGCRMLTVGVTLLAGSLLEGIGPILCVLRYWSVDWVRRECSVVSLGWTGNEVVSDIVLISS